MIIREWQHARRVSLKKLGHVHAILDRLRINAAALGQPAWLAGDTQVAFDAVVAVIRTLESASVEVGLPPRPTREQVLRACFRESRPAPGVPIQWHLPTAAYDFCPDCGLPEINQVRRTERVCARCGYTEQRPQTIEAWTARHFGMLGRQHPKSRNRASGQPGLTILCQEEGCERLALQDGRCSYHYFAQKTQRPRGPYQTTQDRPTCCIPGCPRPVLCKQRCGKHYRRYMYRKKQGCSDADADAERRARRCTVDGCLAPHHAQGLCVKHYTQQHRKEAL